MVCSFGIYIVIKQDIVIFSLAQTIDDSRDYSESGRNRNLNKIIDANDTITFNKAVLHCLQRQNTLGNFKSVMGTYKDIWIEGLTVVVIFGTSLVCYPGLILQTKLSFVTNESWLQVMLIASYTVFDVAGRFFTSLFKTVPRKRFLVSLSYLRLIFIFTSLMIGLNKNPTWLFGSDWFKLLNSILIGFGNGVLGTFIMIKGATIVSRKESETAGFIMAFHMTLGRGLGSLISGIGLMNYFK